MKLVIADDEMLTLRMMEDIIDWEAMGINIVGLVSNGKEAQSIIERDYPEILITDVRMPEVDGLELTKWVRANNFNLKSIIVSAHSEFEYAQKALNYGASGYLLKPVDETELEELVGKVIYEIMREKSLLSNSREGKRTDDVNIENSKMIKRAKEYIRLNYNTVITLEEICAYIPVSKSYFCCLFKKETGESIWEYLTRFRIEKAKEFIYHTDMKNYEISYKVGYENPSYFAKTFKKITGATPHVYRERQKY